MLLGEICGPAGAARHFTLGENGRSPVRETAIDGGVESAPVGSRLAVSSADLYSGRGVGHIVDQVLVGHPPRKTDKTVSPWQYKPMMLLADQIHKLVLTQAKVA